MPHTGALVNWAVALIADLTSEGRGHKVFRSFELHTEAAALGSCVAQLNLAWHYLNGYGVPQNFKAGIDALSAAARYCFHHS